MGIFYESNGLHICCHAGESQYNTVTCNITFLFILRVTVEVSPKQFHSTIPLEQQFEWCNGNKKGVCLFGMVISVHDTYSIFVGATLPFRLGHGSLLCSVLLFGMLFL